MSLDRASVLAYLETHSTTQTANHFHVSDRYVRKLRASSRPAASSVLVMPPDASSHSAVPAVVRSSTQNNAAGTISVSAPAVDWVRVPGQRGLRRVVRNSLHEPSVGGAPELPPTLAGSAGVVPDLVPALSVSSGPVPAFSKVLPSVGLHNDFRSSGAPVKHSAHIPAQISPLVWFLSASVGPLPLPALLLGLFLICLSWGLL